MFPVEGILKSIWEHLKVDIIISADITAIRYVYFDKSVVTGAALKSFLVECTTDDQCEPEETDFDQPSPIIPTANVSLQIIESIRQLMTHKSITYNNWKISLKRKKSDVL